MIKKNLMEPSMRLNTWWIIGIIVLILTVIGITVGVVLVVSEDKKNKKRAREAEAIALEEMRRMLKTGPQIQNTSIDW
jgi:flagellar basal body-associated protein FliL